MFVKLHVTFLLALAPLASADVELPALFSDGMVLQRDADIPVWGRASAGEAIRVELGEDVRTTTANDQGEWRLTLAPLPAGGPHELRVSGDNQIEIEDVLVGEVWLGAGQSNMVMHAQHCVGYEEEAARSDRPRIRMFHEDSGPASTRQWQGAGRWVKTSPETFGEFSAVLFYFGRHLEEELDVPIGLIDSSISGTPIQAWTSRDAQFGCEALAESVADEDEWYNKFDPDKEKVAHLRRLAKWQKLVEEEQASGKVTNRREPQDQTELHMRQGGVGGLFQGKIAPLVPYALRGVVWYQGEQNVRRVWGRTYSVPQPVLYRRHLELLVSDWRDQWSSPELPFAWVQLPNFGDGREGCDWPTLRDSQRRALSLPGTGMAITIDQGERTNIHPYEKREVSRRLALWALGKVYGRPGPTSGPLYASHEVNSGKLIVHFSHVDGGLQSPKKGPLKSFEIAGADGVWHPAKAWIAGDAVLLHASEVPVPVHARYAWANDPRVTLFDGAGLPASPFTTLDPEE